MASKRPLVEFPTRDTDQLYASHVTCLCAFHGCIPCAYKIACFDVALDKEFCRQRPNQRPESCPRATSDDNRAVYGYQSGLRVLTVGDGDFSFSLAIARKVGALGKVWATSYEPKETLLDVYPDIAFTIEELQSLGAMIFFQVDGTQLEATMPDVKTQKFDRIVWNFPCTAIGRGQDGQNAEMDRNKELVRHFLANARFLLADHGEIHMNHKTKPPFNQWKIEEVALELANEGEPRMRYCGRMVLDRYLLPPYTPRKALDRKSFPVHDACTYIFGLSRDSKQLSDDVIQSECGSDDPIALLPVTLELIERLRTTLLKMQTRKSSNSKKKKRKFN